METKQLTRHADSALVLPQLARPVSFAGLMTLYESNYVRLKWILPELPGVHTRLVSMVPGDGPLSLHVAEACRYTTTLTLTYLFQRGAQLEADPDLAIRVYHDAMMVEAMDCGSCRRHPVLRRYAPGGGSELQRRWQRNMMLNKWLEFCADHGHRFTVTAR